MTACNCRQCLEVERMRDLEDRSRRLSDAQQTIVLLRDEVARLRERALSDADLRLAYSIARGYQRSDPQAGSSQLTSLVDRLSALLKGGAK